MSRRFARALKRYASNWIPHGNARSIRLKVLDAVASAQDKEELDTQEQNALLESVETIDLALTTLRVTAGSELSGKISGTEPAGEIINQWKQLIDRAE